MLPFSHAPLILDYTLFKLTAHFLQNKVRDFEELQGKFDITSSNSGC